MKFATVAFLLALVVGCLAVAQANDETEAAHMRVRRGFGCPINMFCHRHCKSIGRRGGYCEGAFKLTCVCYR